MKKHLYVNISSLESENKAFTLAEAIIVLVVLGVVAALTIPAVIRRQIQATNRTKVKKIMQVYDLLLGKMIAENDIKSNAALSEWADSNNCRNSSSQFKPVKFLLNADGTENHCKFKDASGITWDITSITDPIVTLGDESELENPDSPLTFNLHGHFDNTGILRVNDLGWEKSHATNIQIINDIEKLHNPPKTSAKTTTQKIKYDKITKYYDNGNIKEENTYYTDSTGRKILYERKSYEEDGRLSTKTTWDENTQIVKKVQLQTNGTYIENWQPYTETNGKDYTKGSDDLYYHYYLGSSTGSTQKTLKEITYNTYDDEKGTGQISKELIYNSINYKKEKETSITYKNGEENTKTVTNYSYNSALQSNKQISKEEYKNGKISAITNYAYDGAGNQSQILKTTYSDYEKGLKTQENKTEYKKDSSGDITEKIVTTTKYKNTDETNIFKSETITITSYQTGELISTCTKYKEDGPCI